MRTQPVFAAALVALALLAASAGTAGAAGGPSQNLWVEVRWVDSAVSAAAVTAVQGGAVVVGTAGSVSPRGGQGLVSTSRRDEPQVQRLLVLNGHQASVQLTETTPVQWLDFGVQFDAGAGGAAPTQAAAAAANTGNGGNGSNTNKGWAVLRSGVTEQTRGFTVTPQWPGGQQPVRVELRAQSGGSAPVQSQSQSQTQAQIVSTVSVALGQWLTVARSGAASQRQERGVISSRSAEAQTARELQLRVELAP